MNKKTVCKILHKKHLDWCNSIEDEEVRHLALENTIITGGAIVSMLLGERIKDYDIYFRNVQTVEAVARYYVNKFNDDNPNKNYKPSVSIKDGRISIFIRSDGVSVSDEFDNANSQEDIEYMDHILDSIGEKDSDDAQKSDIKYYPVFMSDNAITLSDSVQIVIRFYGEPDDIHKNYDFVHCTNYWTSWDNKLTLRQAALESIIAKELIYQGSLYPVCSVIRTRKFIQRGWYINAGQYLKMCFQISQLDLTDLNILREQLTGVDALYFFQVIDYCEKRKNEDSEFVLSVPYLVEVIDRIFG